MNRLPSPAGAGLVLGLALASCAPSPPAPEVPAQAALLEIRAIYRGLDCPPVGARPVPPCSGPLAQLGFEVLDGAGRSVASGVTDASGRALARARAGDYLLRAVWRERTIFEREIRLAPAQSLEVPIAVDAGIR